MQLNRRQLDTFTSVMDALLPPGTGPGSVRRGSASDLGLPSRIPELMDRLPDDRSRAELRRLLRLMSSHVGGRVLYGKGRPFAALSPPEATVALRRMAASRLLRTRQAFQVLKRLTGFVLATRMPGSAGCALWDEVGYPGPLAPPPQTPRSIHPLPVTAPATWEADVVVVGSGAGGGTAAGILAGAGLDVVVLEKGGYRNESDFTHYEDEAYRDLYLDGALAATSDLAIGLLAGSNLGGGTTVNWTTSFATPTLVKEEWDREAGFDGVFTGDAYESASRAVHDRLGITTEQGAPSTTDAVMEKGLRDLGWHVGTLPRNVAGCDPGQCGYCTMGCRTGAKRGTLRTYLEDAAAAGTRIVVNADVRRIHAEYGKVVGVEADVGGNRVVVRAPTVILAAGALNTPAVLQRSRLGGPAAGRHLRLHPVTVVWGRFPERLDPWSGILQSRYSDEFTDLDGEGYGFKFETGPVHPAFPASFFGWDSGPQWKEALLAMAHWSPVGILLRDRGSGRVRVRRDGSPFWEYRLDGSDLAHMRTGVRRAAQVLQAAGAEEVLASTSVPVSWAAQGTAPLERFVAGVDAVGYGPGQTTYLSFHQMGSARMGSNPERSVTDADNEVHGVSGLYVMDGSSFPTASGVNPMISIQTIAHRAATALAERLA